MPSAKYPFYRPLIESLDDECEFNPPAAFFEILDVEETFGVTLPDEIKDLLRESNGVRYDYGAGLIWSTAEIKKNNLEFRAQTDFPALYMPFDCLLFFGDDGGGDHFGYAVLGGEIRWYNIFTWCHEDDSRIFTAGSLEQYLRGRLTQNKNQD